MTSTNDGKDVKSNQTSGPKGKTYYIELYKSLEAGLSKDCELSERTQNLCNAWRRVHSLCAHSAPSTHPHLLSWLQRHTAKTVLQTEWQDPTNKDEHSHLEEAINDFITESQSSKDGDPPWQTQLVARGEWFKRILASPWGHPVLKMLLDPQGEETPTDEDVLTWLKDERGVMFVTRLRQLAATKNCHDLALRLASAIMDRVRAGLDPPKDDQVDDPIEKERLEVGSLFLNILKAEAGFTVDVLELLTDIEFVLLHKRDKRAQCIELAKQTSLRNGYQLVERLQSRLGTSPREKKLWKNAKEVATLIAQVVIARCMVVPACGGASRTALYCCTRSLVRLVAAPRLPAAAQQLAMPAATARHLHTLAAAVDAQSSSDMKPHVCELYVRAITAGMNELERLKLNTEKESEARASEQMLSQWFMQLGGVLAASERMRGECTLTAFSVHPSPHMYDNIKDAPALLPVALDIEPKSEQTNSEYGSWASDSRSQTNFVKTSETLNLKKHSQHQANVLSTAILTEGEALGLSPELCQDIVVLLSGPRLKTLSWDMDRTLLLENCRTYMERTNFGTRALTTELKYLNLDLREYEHLPEEEEDDSDMYYGIEKGYEHLVEFQEAEEIWQDAHDSERTDSAYPSDMETEINKPKRKSKKIYIDSDEDEDPLSMLAEASRVERQKERPLSKERKERKPRAKTKQKDTQPTDPSQLTDPLAIGENTTQPDGNNVTTVADKKKPTKKKQSTDRKKNTSTERKTQSLERKKEPKEKKERKRKEKSVSKESKAPLSSLIGMKIANMANKIPQVDSDFDSQGNYSIPSEGTETDVLFDGLFSMDEIKSPEKSFRNNEMHMANGVVTPDYRRMETIRMGTPVRTPTPTRTPTPNRAHTPSLNRSDTRTPENLTTVTEEVKKSITRLIEFRRQKAASQVQQPNIFMQPNLQPNNKYQYPHPHIQPQFSQIQTDYMSTAYSNKSHPNSTQETNTLNQHKAVVQPVIQFGPNQSQQPNYTFDATGMKVNTESSKPSKYTNANVGTKIPEMPFRPKSVAHPQTKSNKVTSHQKDFHDFLKELQESINAGTGSQAKKEVKPSNRTNPVVPKSDSKATPSAKQPIKPPDTAPNTFSRLSYYKSTKNEIKAKLLVDAIVEQQSQKLQKNEIKAKQLVDAIVEQQQQRLTNSPSFADLDRILEEQKQAKMKYLQTTKESVIKPPRPIDNTHNVIKRSPSTSRDHPLISGLLNNSLNVSKTSVNQCNNVKAEKPRDLSNKLASSLTEKDQQDLVLLLRQQSKQNLSRPISDTSKERVPPPQTTSSTGPTYKAPSMVNKRVLDLSTSVIKNNPSQAKPSSGAKPAKERRPAPKPIIVKTELSHAKNLNQVHSKIQKVEVIDNEGRSVKSSTNVSKGKQDGKSTDWETVMDAILKHKTPSRGPNALDMTLKNVTFMNAFENSLRDQGIVKPPSRCSSESMLCTPTRDTKESPTKPESKSVIEHGQNINILRRSNTDIKITKTTKAKSKKTAVNPSVEVQLNPSSSVKMQHPENRSLLKCQQPKKVNTDKKSKDTTGTKRRVERKQQFTCPLPTEDDPFISGIPNSDYDLLEELMDDDLRQEIGELLSDDDCYNAAIPGVKEARAFVGINKTISPAQEVKRIFPPPVINAFSKPQQKNNVQKAPISLSKPNYDATIPIGEPAGYTKIPVHPEYSKVQKIITQPTTNIVNQMPASVIVPPKNEHYVNAVPSMDQTYVAVPQPTNLKNVVLIGPDLVYQPCVQTVPAVRTSIHTALPHNTYVTFNPQPNIAVYQTTHYTAPVINPLIIGNAMTTSSAPVTAQPFTSNIISPKPHTAPELVQPQRTQSQWAHPQMTQLQMSQPHMTQPQMNQHQMTQPQMRQPQMTQPQMSQPQLTQPQLTQPQMTQLQMSLPQTAQPQMSQPQMTQPQMTQPEMTQPQMSQPQMTQPQMNRPQMSQQLKTQPQMTQPQITQAQMAQSQMAQPQMAQPQMTQPKMVQSRVAKETISQKLINEVPLSNSRVDYLHDDFVLKDKCDNNSNKNGERKVLSEMQELIYEEKVELNTKSQKLSFDHDVKKAADAERLKLKRMAILNRNINHRSNINPIPLTYTPLMTKQPEEDTKEENILDQKSNANSSNYTMVYSSLETYDAEVTYTDKPIEIKEVVNENCKENNKGATPCRRILLRSSNKLKSEAVASYTVKTPPAKIKVKLKMPLDTTEPVKSAESSDDVLTPDTGSPKVIKKRAPKKSLNKSMENVEFKKRITRQSSRNALAKNESDKHDHENTVLIALDNTDEKTVATNDNAPVIDLLDLMDIEDQLASAKILKNTCPETFMMEDDNDDTVEKTEPVSNKGSNTEAVPLLEVKDLSNVVINPPTPIIIDDDSLSQSDVVTSKPIESNNMIVNELIDKVNDEYIESVILEHSNDAVNICEEVTDIQNTQSNTNKAEELPILTKEIVDITEPKDVAKHAEEANTVQKESVRIKKSKANNAKNKENPSTARIDTVDIKESNEGAAKKKVSKNENKVDIIEKLPQAQKVPTSSDSSEVDTNKLDKMPTAKKPPPKIAQSAVKAKTRPQKITATEVNPTKDKIHVQDNEPEVICLDNDDDAGSINKTNNSETFEVVENSLFKTKSANPEKPKDKDSDWSKAFLEGVTIEEIKQSDINDPLRRCVRIKLPNGRAFKATVRGQAHISIDTIFSDPALKSVLMRGDVNRRDKYTLNIKQYSTQNTINKRIDTRIQEISLQTPACFKKNETISLLSDDEEDDFLYFDTEFGKYKVPSMQSVLHKNHQNRLNNKCVVKLRRDNLNQHEDVEFEMIVPDEMSDPIKDIATVDNPKSTNSAISKKVISGSESGLPDVTKSTELLLNSKKGNIFGTVIPDIAESSKKLFEPISKETTVEASTKQLPDPIIKETPTETIVPDVTESTKVFRHTVPNEVISIKAKKDPMQKQKIAETIIPGFAESAKYLLNSITKDIVSDIDKSPKLLLDTSSKEVVSPVTLKSKTFEPEVIEIDDSSNDDLSLNQPENVQTKDKTTEDTILELKSVLLKERGVEETHDNFVELETPIKLLAEKSDELIIPDIITDALTKSLETSPVHTSRYASHLPVVDRNCFVALTNCDELVKKYNKLKQCSINLIRCDESSQDESINLESENDETISDLPEIGLEDEFDLDSAPLSRSGSFSILNDCELLNEPSKEMYKCTSPVMDVYESIAALFNRQSENKLQKHTWICETEWFMSKTEIHLQFGNIECNVNDLNNTEDRNDTSEFYMATDILRTETEDCNFKVPNLVTILTKFFQTNSVWYKIGIYNNKSLKLKRKYQDNAKVVNKLFKMRRNSTVEQNCYDNNEDVPDLEGALPKTSNFEDITSPVLMLNENVEFNTDTSPEHLQPTSLRDIEQMEEITTAFIHQKSDVLEVQNNNTPSTDETTSKNINIDFKEDMLVENELPNIPSSPLAESLPKQDNSILVATDKKYSNDCEECHTKTLKDEQSDNREYVFMCDPPALMDRCSTPVPKLNESSVSENISTDVMTVQEQQSTDCNDIILGNQESIDSVTTEPYLINDTTTEEEISSDCLGEEKQRNYCGQAGLSNTHSSDPEPVVINATTDLIVTEKQQPPSDCQKSDTLAEAIQSKIKYMDVDISEQAHDNVTLGAIESTQDLSYSDVSNDLINTSTESKHFKDSIEQHRDSDSILFKTIDSEMSNEPVPDNNENTDLQNTSGSILENCNLMAFEEDRSCNENTTPFNEVQSIKEKESFIVENEISTEIDTSESESQSKNSMGSYLPAIKEHLLNQNKKVTSTEENAAPSRETLTNNEALVSQNENTEIIDAELSCVQNLESSRDSRNKKLELPELNIIVLDTSNTSENTEIVINDTISDENLTSCVVSSSKITTSLVTIISESNSTDASELHDKNIDDCGQHFDNNNDLKTPSDYEDTVSSDAIELTQTMLSLPSEITSGASEVQDDIIPSSVDYEDKATKIEEMKRSEMDTNKADGDNDTPVDENMLSSNNYEDIILIDNSQSEATSTTADITKIDSSVSNDAIVSKSATPEPRQVPCNEKNTGIDDLLKTDNEENDEVLIGAYDKQETETISSADESVLICSSNDSTQDELQSDIEVDSRSQDNKTIFMQEDSNVDVVCISDFMLEESNNAVDFTIAPEPDTDNIISHLKISNDYVKVEVNKNIEVELTTEDVSLEDSVDYSIIATDKTYSENVNKTSDGDVNLSKDIVYNKMLDEKDKSKHTSDAMFDDISIKLQEMFGTNKNSNISEQPAEKEKMNIIDQKHLQNGEESINTIEYLENVNDCREPSDSVKDVQSTDKSNNEIDLITKIDKPVDGNLQTNLVEVVIPIYSDEIIDEELTNIVLESANKNGENNITDKNHDVTLQEQKQIDIVVEISDSSTEHDFSTERSNGNKSTCVTESNIKIDDFVENAVDVDTNKITVLGSTSNNMDNNAQNKLVSILGDDWQTQSTKEDLIKQLTSDNSCSSIESKYLPGDNNVELVQNDLAPDIVEVGSNDELEQELARIVLGSAESDETDNQILIINADNLEFDEVKVCCIQQSELQKLIRIDNQDGNPKLSLMDYENSDVQTSHLIRDDDDCSQTSDDILQITQEMDEFGNVKEIDIRLNVPKKTYSRKTLDKDYTLFGDKRNKRILKRKGDMTDLRTPERKYRKSKNIDTLKLTVIAKAETAYSKEYKQLFDYCSSVKFSYSRPFHKEYIDVEEMLKSWPIQGNCNVEVESQIDENLFNDTDTITKSIHDPLTQTLAEEIMTEYSENSYSLSDAKETNFLMGFGEGSGRVIQNSEDDGVLKFSAATLSDVKQTQPLLPSENYDECNSVQDDDMIDSTKQEIEKLQRNYKCIQLKNKVRSFFKNSMIELNNEWAKQLNKTDDDYSNEDRLVNKSCFPFGLNQPDFITPPPIEVVVQVVQIGQLPISAAAQNPVTCDPRVTQVSNVSPSQCSADNNLSDDPHSVIKTEYTELTTADISLPLQNYVHHHHNLMPSESHELTSMHLSNEIIIEEIKEEIKEEIIDEPEMCEEISNHYDNDRMSDYDSTHIANSNFNNNVDYTYESTPPNHLSPTTTVSETTLDIMYNSSDKTHEQQAQHMQLAQQNHQGHIAQNQQAQIDHQTQQSHIEYQNQQTHIALQNHQAQIAQQNQQAQIAQQSQQAQVSHQNQQAQIAQQSQQAQVSHQNQQAQIAQQSQQAQVSHQNPQAQIAQQSQQAQVSHQNHQAQIAQQSQQAQVSHQNQQAQIAQQSQQAQVSHQTQQAQENHTQISHQTQLVQIAQQNQQSQVQQNSQSQLQQQNSQPQFQQQNSQGQLQQPHIHVQKQQEPPPLQSQQAQPSQQNRQEQQNGTVEKTDQIAHAMNAAGISTSPENITNTRTHTLVNILSQKLRQGTVGATTASAYPKTTQINAMALQQALAQILPPPLNPTNNSESNQQNSSTPQPQVLHIVQGKNASGNQITLVDNSQPSVISTSNATPVLHIVQNKANTSGSTSNGTPPQHTNSFSGLSLVDAGLQQGNQLVHIVNAGNQKNANAGQLLRKVNLLTNLANVQGSNEQKMVQFVCKSADGKAIQLNGPHQRSMVLRLQPVESPGLQMTQSKPAESTDANPPSGTSNNISNKDAASQQEIKSRSVYEENYAKFIQSSNKPGTEKATSLPKFGQAFGKQVFQEGAQKNDATNGNSHLSSSETPDCQPNDNVISLEHIRQLSSPPLLLRKSPQTAQAQPNLVQHLKQTISPMNMSMHGGVIYTRQFPVNIGSGQTINLITVPSTDLIDDSASKQTVNQDVVEPSIIKIVPQAATSSSETPEENNSHASGSNETATPQPVLTQMRIKLPMLSKGPQMVSGARIVRPSFFQIQRNVIGGANQPVYQQLVLTAAPPLGQQTIRLPQTQTSRQVKVASDSQSSSEPQMSSSTLEQLREFDLVLEQIKERSTSSGTSTTSSENSFKLHTLSTDTNDSAASASSTSAQTTQQVLYSIGSSQPLNVTYVNRKVTSATPTTSSFQRSPDSSGIVETPSSSTHQRSRTITSESSASDTPASSSHASHSGHSTQQSKPPKPKAKPRPKAASNPPNTLKLPPAPPKTSTQKPAEDEQTTQRILYILAEYKEQVENSPDKDKPAPRRRTNLPSNPGGSSKRKKSCSGSRRSGRDMSPCHVDESCRTMGSEDSSCGTSGDCNDCLESHSPQDSPRKVVRKLTFDHETPTLSTQPRPQPQRNVIVADGQTITVARGTSGKPTTAVLMPANYILPVSMMKGGQQIAIVTNRGPKLLTVGGAEGTTNALLLQRLIGPAGLKPVLTRPGVRHVRLPTAALQNLQTFNLTTAAPTTTVQPPDSTASPAPAPTPELVDTRANSSPWRSDRDSHSQKSERERASSPEGSEPWHLPPSDYSYEETVRAENMDRTVLDPIPDRYSPDMEAQRIFDKMFDVDSKKSYMVDDSPRCGYDIDASDCDDKAYHQVVHKKEGSAHRQHRFANMTALALRNKYSVLDRELQLQKSLSEECEDLGVDSPSASELFPEAELLFAASPAHDHTQDHGHHSHTPQPLMTQSGISQPDMDDQIATDQLLPRSHVHDDRELGLGLEDVGIVTVSADGMQATIQLDQEEFARSHPNTTFHSEPTDEGEVQQPYTISGLKTRHITSTVFHSHRPQGTVLMTAPSQTTVISQATAETSGNHHNAIKYSDIDNMINSLPSTHSHNINLSSVLVKDDGLSRFDNLLNDSRELHLSNTASAIVHSAGHATQVIRRVCYEDDKRERVNRFLMDEPEGLNAGDESKMMAEDSSRDATLESMGGDTTASSPDRHTELFWESNSASGRADFSSDSEKCCKSPSDDTSTDSSAGVGLRAHMRLDSVIKEARGLASDDDGPPLRTYPAPRSLSGKTAPPGAGGGGRRRASGRGVVKRGSCLCCVPDAAPPRPKKPRQRRPALDFAAAN